MKHAALTYVKNGFSAIPLHEHRLFKSVRNQQGPIYSSLVEADYFLNIVLLRIKPWTR